MTTSCYDVGNLASRYDMFLDGTTISKMIVHPQNRGAKIELYGLHATAKRSSINVVSQTSSVIARVTAIDQPAHYCYGYRILVTLEAKCKSRDIFPSDLGMIYLKLVYFTPSVHWLPRYTLDIRKDGDAVLCLQARVSQRLPWNDSIRSVSNCFVEPANEYALDVRGARREEHAPGQLPTSFTEHTWVLASRYAQGLAMGPVCIADCVVNVDPEDQMLSSWLRATMNATRAWSLPAGTMEITRHGDQIESARMPLWNPGQDLIIGIKSNSRGPAWDPCRIRCLLNESVSERHSSQYHVQITTEAGDQAETLGRVSNREALSPDNNDGSVQGSQERQLHLTERNLERYTLSQGQISDGELMRRYRLSTYADDITDATKQPPETVALEISTKWQDNQACKWVSSRGRWETFAEGNAFLIEVLLADKQEPGSDNREPIHLKPWSRSQWKGCLCNGSSLYMDVDEVKRLLSLGGLGRGTLVY